MNLHHAPLGIADVKLHLSSEVEECTESHCTMNDDEVVCINKRGWQYVSWNYDNPNHHEDTRSLYGAHNFIIIHGTVTFGAFFDFAGKMEFLNE